MQELFNKDTTMKEVEAQYPYARSTLHTKFHIGGCQKCGYEPNQTIENVAQNYSKNTDVLLNALNEAKGNMLDAEISQEKLKQLLKCPENLMLIDVREEWEFKIAHIPNSFLMDESNFKILLKKAQESLHVIVICHHGMRSMNATLYLREHGIHHAQSLRGGIDAFSKVVDSSIQRY